MILYVNGDSHAAAAEAVNAHSWAEDDSQYFYLGHAPHPDNMAVGWPRRLADTVKAALGVFAPMMREAELPSLRDRRCVAAATAAGRGVKGAAVEPLTSAVERLA